MQKQFPPEFSALMQQYKDTAAGLGDDHPIARRLLMLAIQTAPDWFVSETHDMARSMGLLPEAWGCDESGQRFYAVNDIAAKLGMGADEVTQQMTMLQADAAALGLPDVLLATDAQELHRLH